jgi:hypothetical protein
MLPVYHRPSIKAIGSSRAGGRLAAPNRITDRIGGTSGSFFRHPEAWPYLAYQWLL